MKRVGAPPNSETYVALIEACVKAGDVHSALVALQELFAS
jgi:pentatricopeptide repeat protein